MGELSYVLWDNLLIYCGMSTAGFPTMGEFNCILWIIYCRTVYFGKFHCRKSYCGIPTMG